ncbi:hypothetical protein [Rhodoplanes sp. Z2-YC6860]|uniref:hypothetical protein n=1 Tax=Rhodoplanes sp. Z2-YC6860 TaxID=674703 RepID=UPI00078CA4FD|nr:hypothetical protein [Rhodoplanes sp. Z2-YC6860]AMN44058.1 TOPRIM domain-containing protein [Rhodoplanes sp. Z2-YC6860]
MPEALPTPAEIVDLALTAKPELMVVASDIPSTVHALRDLLAASDKMFDRGVPVRFVRTPDGSPAAIPLTKNNVIIAAHRLCRPMKANVGAEPVPITLPDRVAQMYLDMVGDWDLKPLSGFSMSPILSADGSLRSHNGYDPETQLWCCSVPEVFVPPNPNQAEAKASLQKVRQAFRTFPFSDAVRTRDDSGIEVVDLAQPPGQDESAFLIGLMTACCRSSLWLAPGLLLTAPSLSGAGSGKGLLVRSICAIAFGVRPRAFTTGSDRQELEKRLAAELIEAQPALFLDNANGVALRSDTLASVLTERPARVRLLGQTRMVPLNSTAFIAVTGNGLTVTEDLARRFLYCTLDARCEDPESRPFQSGFLEQIDTRRAELLTAMLTIWRWGRLNAIPKGRPLGSFEAWSEWCRDPLLALGCTDPVQRIETLKAHDPKRQRIADFFQAWWQHHQATPIKLKDLDEAARALLDPHNRGRQYVANAVQGLAGTHAAGFVLTRQDAAGKWGRTTYALEKASREHHHRQPPMTPMPSEVEDERSITPGEEATI